MINNKGGCMNTTTNENNALKEIQEAIKKIDIIDSTTERTIIDGYENTVNFVMHEVTLTKQEKLNTLLTFFHKHENDNALQKELLYKLIDGKLDGGDFYFNEVTKELQGLNAWKNCIKVLQEASKSWQAKNASKELFAKLQSTIDFNDITTDNLDTLIQVLQDKQKEQATSTDATDTKKKLITDLCTIPTTAIDKSTQRKLFDFIDTTPKSNKIIDSIKSIDSTNAFTPACFYNVTFETGTINVIAARPAGGKTTTLITLAIDALHETHLDRHGNELTTDKDGNSILPRKIIYITAEESERNLYTRLITAETFRLYENDNSEPPTENENNRTFNPRNELMDFIRKEYQGDLKDAFINKLTTAKNIIDNAIDTGQIMLYAVTNQDALINYMQTIPPDTLVLVDYIQKLPFNEALTGGNDRLGIAKNSEMLCDSAKRKNLIVIVGAQCNRSTDIYNLDYNDIKDCGNIEQDAFIIVGLASFYAYDSNGYKKRLNYCKMLKNRYGELDDNCYFLDPCKTNTMLSYSNMDFNKNFTGHIYAIEKNRSTPAHAEVTFTNNNNTIKFTTLEPKDKEKGNEQQEGQDTDNSSNNAQTQDNSFTFGNRNGLKGARGA